MLKEFGAIIGYSVGGVGGAIIGSNLGKILDETDN